MIIRPHIDEPTEPLAHRRPRLGVPVPAPHLKDTLVVSARIDRHVQKKLYTTDRVWSVYRWEATGHSPLQWRQRTDETASL